MTAKNKMELRIPSILGYEKLAMDFAASVGRLLKLPEQRIEDLRTAVSEACINAIEHGHRFDANVRVGIGFTLEEMELEIDVTDEAEESIGQPPVPDIDEKIAGKDTPRGWGVFLIKNLVDDVRFETNPGKGNSVKMIFHVDKSHTPNC
jgi:serine/threonine-protein kinase RsbW